jgi:hypothetical protein
MTLTESLRSRLRRRSAGEQYARELGPDRTTTDDTTTTENPQPCSECGGLGIDPQTGDRCPCCREEETLSDDTP